MNYEPKTEEQINEDGLIPKGECDFEIVEAKDAVSKNGNDMIVLKIKLFGDDGRQRITDDYLLEILAYKLRHAAVACGLDYESGQIVAEQFVGKCGRCKVDIEKSDGYPSKNVIKDYVVPERDGAPAPVAAEPVLDDQIPWQ